MSKIFPIINSGCINPSANILADPAAALPMYWNLSATVFTSLPAFLISSLNSSLSFVFNSSISDDICPNPNAPSSLLVLVSNAPVAPTVFSTFSSSASRFSSSFKASFSIAYPALLALSIACPASVLLSSAVSACTFLLKSSKLIFAFSCRAFNCLVLNP